MSNLYLEKRPSHVSHASTGWADGVSMETTLRSEELSLLKQETDALINSLFHQI